MITYICVLLGYLVISINLYWGDPTINQWLVAATLVAIVTLSLIVCTWSPKEIQQWLCRKNSFWYMINDEGYLELSPRATECLCGFTLQYLNRSAGFSTKLQYWWARQYLVLSFWIISLGVFPQHGWEDIVVPCAGIWILVIVPWGLVRHLRKRTVASCPALGSPCINTVVALTELKNHDHGALRLWRWYVGEYSPTLLLIGVRARIRQLRRNDKVL